MKIQLPPNFDMKAPHKALVFCPSCHKYQHFSFNRPRCLMWCNGCGSKFSFAYMDYKPYECSSMDYGLKGRVMYGPPKYLMVYNHWHDNPDCKVSDIWRTWYWDICSYNTLQRWIRCIKKDLKGLEKV